MDVPFGLGACPVRIVPTHGLHCRPIATILFQRPVLPGLVPQEGEHPRGSHREPSRLTLIKSNILPKRRQAADTQNVCAIVKNAVEEHGMMSGSDEPGMADVKLVANVTMQIAYRNKDRLSAGMIIAGWDRRAGPQVFGIPLGGSLEKCDFTLGGSGSAYITGFCDDTWKPGMSREDAEAWIRRAISIAISRDASSGGVIRLVTIHEKGCDRQMFEPAQHPLAYDELPVIRREEVVA